MAAADDDDLRAFEKTLRKGRALRVVSDWLPTVGHMVLLLLGLLFSGLVFMLKVWGAVQLCKAMGWC